MSPPRDTCAAIVAAAGQGTRAGSDKPKQFASVGGRPMVRLAVDHLLAGGIRRVVVVVPSEAMDEAATALRGTPASIVAGGATRQASARNGLEALALGDAPETVLIHDAARPFLPADVIDRLLAALDGHPAAIPVVPAIDSMVRGHQVMTRSEPRDGLHRVQTPQAFRFADILAAHRNWTGAPGAGDDAVVAQAAGLAVALVEGDERLKKLTYPHDFAPGRLAVRVGTGFDVHRLADGEALWLAGIRVPHDRGLVGHSDADVAIHALVDALLGAIGAGDIGQHFPPSDPQWRGAASDQFLAHTMSLVRAAGYDLGNVDLTIVCETPRIGGHRPAMIARLAAIMAVEPAQISIKATTTEGLGATGRGEGIAAQAVATLVAEA